jgi:hypothetical protein
MAESGKRVMTFGGSTRISFVRKWSTKGFPGVPIPVPSSGWPDWLRAPVSIFTVKVVRNGKCAAGVKFRTVLFGSQLSVPVTGGVMENAARTVPVSMRVEKPIVTGRVGRTDVSLFAGEAETIVGKPVDSSARSAKRVAPAPTVT